MEPGLQSPLPSHGISAGSQLQRQDDERPCACCKREAPPRPVLRHRWGNLGCRGWLLRLQAQRTCTKAAVQGESRSCGPLVPLGAPALGANVSSRDTFDQLGAPRIKAQHKQKLWGIKERAKIASICPHRPLFSMPEPISPARTPKPALLPQNYSFSPAFAPAISHPIITQVLTNFLLAST